MSIQLLQEISNNYQIALSVHRELADVFWFVGMQGYALWNEYQYIDESCTQRKVKKYISETYHTYSPDKLPESANIADPLLSGKNRKKLKSEDTYKIIQESFRIYQEWEESALQEYQRIAKELMEVGSVSAFNFVSEIIKDVKAELDFVTTKCIELSAHEYDMAQVVAEQNEIFERYEYLIKKMFGKSEKFHYHNSSVDPESRKLFEKSSE